MKTKARPAAHLSSVEQEFVLHWGEMGTRWGINRTVALVHALLFISPRPLNADEIVDALGVTRSNVSTSLRELQGWGIVKLTHVLGNKRPIREPEGRVGAVPHRDGRARQSDQRIHRAAPARPPRFL